MWHQVPPARPRRSQRLSLNPLSAACSVSGASPVCPPPRMQCTAPAHALAACVDCQAGRALALLLHTFPYKDAAAAVVTW